jgi:hypothetical protein
VTKNSNTLEVAVLPGNRFMDLGITSDSSTTLVPNGDDDALINLRSNGNGDVLFLLNGNTPTIHRMLSLTRNQLGWDPEWANNTAAPDFETEPITLDWAIRKTAINNAYMCALEVTVGTNVYVGMIHYTDSSVSGSQPVDLYVADVARFALSHAYAAQESGTSMLDLSIDAISLTHTNEGTLLKATPYDVSGSATGDKEITISWSGAIEADSYDVYRSTDSGNNYSLLTNTTAQSCVDTTGLADLYTYFYVVKAKYAGGDSDASDPVHVRAVSFSAAPGLEWGPSTDIITAGNVPFVMDNVVSNGLTTSVGNPFTSASGYNTNAAPHLFGVMQTPGTYKRAGMYNNQTPTGNDQFEFNGDGLGYGLIYMEVPGLPLDLSTGAYSMKAESIVRSWHAVIHDSGSGNWYVGDAKYRGDMGALNAQTWRLLDVASTTANNTSLMDYAANPITTPDLTQVDKIGVLSDGGRIRLYHIVVKVGSSASLYDLWSDNYGIYNADAASTNDYDNDGFSNAWEWGMGGDPTNPNNQGIKQAEYLNVGTNMVYIYPRLKSSARPNYFLTEGSNLIYDPPTNSAAYPMEAGGTWINQPDFEAVTNYIPTTDAVKFIKLNIE